VRGGRLAGEHQIEILDQAPPGVRVALSRSMFIAVEHTAAGGVGVMMPG